MKALLAAATLLAFGCGPDLAEPGAQDNAVAAEAALDNLPPRPETPLRLVIIETEEGLAFKLVNDPVEERFFHEVDVTQPPPQMPTPPCPTCR